MKHQFGLASKTRRSYEDDSTAAQRVIQHVAAVQLIESNAVKSQLSTGSASRGSALPL